jgi:hypothetical protein
MLETDEQTQTKVSVGDLLAKKYNMQNPALPVNFVYQVMVCDSADFLLRWLDELGVPLEARLLFNDILFSHMYCSAFHENAGKIPEDLNEACIEHFQEMINIQASAGQTW